MLNMVNKFGAFFILKSEAIFMLKVKPNKNDTKDEPSKGALLFNS